MRFQIRTVHANDQVKLPFGLGADQVRAGQVLETIGEAIREHHLNLFAGVKQSQGKCQAGTNGIPVGADMGSDQNPLRRLNAAFNFFLQVVHSFANQPIGVRCGLRFRA